MTTTTKTATTSQRRLSLIILFVIFYNNIILVVTNAACSVCGEGKQVSAPDAVFTFPNQPPIPCQVLESAGELSIIPESQCQYLPVLITMCECVPRLSPGPVLVTTPPALSAPIAIVPVAAPVFAPVAAPVAAPDTIDPMTIEPTSNPTASPTPAPTTSLPTSTEPTSASPTSRAPTFAPTTPAPTTPQPTTSLPTPDPTTAFPTTVAPTTSDPTSAAPTTPEPTSWPTSVPTTASPTTLAPVPTVGPTPTPTMQRIIIGDDDDDDQFLETQEAPSHSVGSITLGGDDSDDNDETPPPTLEPSFTAAAARSGFYCGKTAADSQNNCHQPCLTSDDCNRARGEECWGSWNTCYNHDHEQQSTTDKTKSPLPTNLQPRSDSRCGVSEVDARSNCGSLCTTNADCNTAGDYCWTTHSNYCHVKLVSWTKEEEEDENKIRSYHHPYCDPTKAEQVHRRCGYDEQAARSFCGRPCQHSLDCADSPGEHCFPVHLNLCDCFQEQDNNRQRQQQEQDISSRRLFLKPSDGQQRFYNRDYFDAVKEPLTKYFVAVANTTTATTNDDLFSSNNNDKHGNSLLLHESTSTSSSSSATSSSCMHFFSTTGVSTLLLIVIMLP